MALGNEAVKETRACSPPLTIVNKTNTVYSQSLLITAVITSYDNLLLAMKEESQSSCFCYSLGFNDMSYEISHHPKTATMMRVRVDKI